MSCACKSIGCEVVLVSICHNEIFPLQIIYIFKQISILHKTLCRYALEDKTMLNIEQLLYWAYYLLSFIILNISSLIWSNSRGTHHKLLSFTRHLTSRVVIEYVLIGNWCGWQNIWPTTLSMIMGSRACMLHNTNLWCVAKTKY